MSLLSVWHKNCLPIHVRVLYLNEKNVFACKLKKKHPFDERRENIGKNSTLYFTKNNLIMKYRQKRNKCLKYAPEAWWKCETLNNSIVRELLFFVFIIFVKMIEIIWWYKKELEFCFKNWVGYLRNSQNCHCCQIFSMLSKVSPTVWWVRWLFVAILEHVHYVSFASPGSFRDNRVVLCWFLI